MTNDGDLLRLFAEFKAAIADAIKHRPVGDPATAAAWRRRAELRAAILSTPAQSVAGIAIKLSLSPSLVPIERNDPGARYENEQAAPICYAFEDALALAGFNRAELFALPA